MPRDTGHEVKVGIFVAVGLGIFALFVIALTGIGFRGGEDVYRVHFKSVAGLENGSVVRLGGLIEGFSSVLDFFFPWTWTNVKMRPWFEKQYPVRPAHRLGCS